MNSSPWRLEEVDGGDEQYPVESCFTVCHTPPDEQDPHFDRRRSKRSLFPPFCGTPHPSRSTGPHFDHRRSKRSPFPQFCGTPDPSR